MEIWKIGNPVHTYKPPIHTHTLSLKNDLSFVMCVYTEDCSIGDDIVLEHGETRELDCLSW